MRITDVITESYDIEHLTQRVLEGHDITDAELDALIEAGAWDTIKKVPGMAARAAGKTVGAIGTGVGAAAGAVPGVGRAIKKGYKQSADYIGGKPQQGAAPQAAPQAAPATTPAGTGVSAFAQALSGMSEADRLKAVAQVLKTFTPKQMKAIRKMIK